MRRRPQLDAVNAPASGLIGQMCRALDFRDGEGRVALGDGTWTARVTDSSQPAAGQALKVVGLDGTTLLVAQLL
jgi:membrane protein implicated in regulation of membrane protease activity